jgi:hypothetical protein
VDARGETGDERVRGREIFGRRRVRHSDIPSCGEQGMIPLLDTHAWLV